MTREVRALLGAAALLASSWSLAACSAPVEAKGCASYAGYETPTDAADASDAVVIATVIGRADDVTIAGGDAHTWTVDVTDWVRGHGDSPLTVAPMPDHCAANPPYQDGDPLEPFADGTPVMLFLYGGDGDALVEGIWTTPNPSQGVIPAPADGRIPATW